MKKKIITIGTRSSELALWQSHFIADSIRKANPSIQVRIHTVKTKGDRILDAPLSMIGDKGLFTKELDLALLDHTIDLAVHSLKDIPTNIPEGLTIACVTERERVEDVFIPNPAYRGMTFNEIPKNGILATSSLRRRSQLLNLRPDLVINDIRGNLNTRMKKLRQSAWHGLILAYAGVYRLGWKESIGEILPVSLFLPAVGQASLGIITRNNDSALIDMLIDMDHKPSRMSTFAERALLRRLEGGCQVPIGANATISGDQIILQAMVGDINGKKVIRDSITGPVRDFEKTGIALAEKLLSRGADKILGEIRNLSAL